MEPGQKRWDAATVGATLALVGLPLVLGVAYLLRDHIPPQWIWYDQGELDADMLIVSWNHADCILALTDSATGLPAEASVAGLECEDRDPWRRLRYERSARDPHLGRIFTFASDGNEGGEGHAEDFVLWIRSDGTSRRGRALSDVPEGLAW